MKTDWIKFDRDVPIDGDHCFVTCRYSGCGDRRFVTTGYFYEGKFYGRYNPHTDPGSKPFINSIQNEVVAWAYYHYPEPFLG